MESTPILRRLRIIGLDHRTSQLFMQISDSMYRNTQPISLVPNWRSEDIGQWCVIFSRYKFTIIRYFPFTPKGGVKRTEFSADSCPRVSISLPSLNFLLPSGFGLCLLPLLFMVGGEAWRESEGRRWPRDLCAGHCPLESKVNRRHTILINDINDRTENSRSRLRFACIWRLHRLE
jgi:hypothetical protein